VSSPLGNVGLLIRNLVGEVGERIIVLLLESKEALSDEEIAEKLGLRINDVRKALYDLVKLGFVTYRRVTRRESYWHSYKWYTNEMMIAQAVLRRKREVLKKLMQRLEFEKENVFYVCPLDGSRYSFDEAFENYFRCPRCGSDLVEIDNRKIIENLERLIEKLRREIEQDEKALSSRPV